MALKGSCAARDPEEGSASKRKRGENLPACTVELFNSVLCQGLWSVVLVRVELALLGSQAVLWPVT